MEDVHKNVITLMDLISVPVGLDMSSLVITILVLVSFLQLHETDKNKNF